MILGGGGGVRLFNIAAHYDHFVCLLAFLFDTMEFGVCLFGCGGAFIGPKTLIIFGRQFGALDGGHVY